MMLNYTLVNLNFMDDLFETVQTFDPHSPNTSYYSVANETNDDEGYKLQTVRFIDVLGVNKYEIG